VENRAACAAALLCEAYFGKAPFLGKRLAPDVHAADSGSKGGFQPENAANNPQFSICRVVVETCTCSYYYNRFRGEICKDLTGMSITADTTDRELGKVAK